MSFEVTQGETFEFDYALLNAGDTDASQDITLTIDGTEEDRDTDVSVGKDGGRVSGMLEWDTSGGIASPAVDTGSYTATVSSADDSESVTIDVVAPGDYAVTITSTNSPVAEGSTLDVDVDVANNGQSDDAQDVTLTVDGAQRDSQTVFLDSEQTKSITLSWATESGDAGDYTATVESNDDTATASVTVDEPAGSTICSSGTLSDYTEFTRLGADGITSNPTIECSTNFTFTENYSLRVEGLTENGERAGVTLDTSGNESTGTLTSWIYVDLSSNTSPGFVVGYETDSSNVVVAPHRVDGGAVDTLGIYDTSTNAGADYYLSVNNAYDLSNIWFNLRLEFNYQNNDDDLQVIADIKFEDNDQGLPTSYEKWVESTATNIAAGPGKVGLAKQSIGTAGADVYWNDPTFNL
jgi:hypothetical protein